MHFCVDRWKAAMVKRACVMVGVGVLASGASGQSLFEAQVSPGEVRGQEGVVDVVGPVSVASVSLIAVEAPEPTTYQEHDLITIIISERAKTSREQTFEQDKSYEIGGRVVSTIDLLKLLELRLEAGRGDGDGLPTWGMNAGTSVDNEATYERDDTVTARVTARVLEVKPNGTLLLEARSTVQTDREIQTITLSGYVRTEDVTVSNTVQSNQMFDLRLSILNSGDVKQGGEKGLIPRALDLLFNF